MKTLGLIMLVLLSGCATQMSDEGVDDKADEAANETHAAEAVELTERAFAGPSHEATSALVAAKAELAEAFPVYFVRLDELQAFSSGTDLNKLLHETNERFHPVIQDGKVTASTTLARTESGWRPVIVGEKRLATRLQDARTRLQATRKLEQKDYSLVKVPALGVRYLAYRQEGKLWLTALDQDDSPEPRAAEEVFAELVTAAKAVQP